MTTETTTWTESAVRVLEERYLLKENGEVIETPDQMCDRVGRAVAQAEAPFLRNRLGGGHWTTYDRAVSEQSVQRAVDDYAAAFADLIRSKKFLPNSPTLMNAGAGNGLQLSACYVLPVEDSIEGIFESVKNAAVIHQSGGGTGFAFSRLRPRGAPVKRSQGVACLTADTILYRDAPRLSRAEREITIGSLLNRTRDKLPRIRSVDAEGEITTAKIREIVPQGRSETFRITAGEYAIRASAEHRFLRDDFTWVEVRGLKPGDKIAANGTAVIGAACARCGKERDLTPATWKYPGHCFSCYSSLLRKPDRRLIGDATLQQEKTEAWRNSPAAAKHAARLADQSADRNPAWKGIDALDTTARQRKENRDYYDAHPYCQRCGSEERAEVHHRDEDPYNNAWSNLETLCNECHRLHHRALKGPLYRKFVQFVEIDSIEGAGIEEVYDIVMEDGMHNFVANGLVTHNSGPVSFMRVFDAATESIKQGGKRRGANMGILRVDHPDIMEFIECKLDGGITNFNISVGVTKAFMEAVEYGEAYTLRDPSDPSEPCGELDTRKVWNAIVDCAWKTGDPGLVFLDRINDSSANPILNWKIESTNPCGEQPLYPYDVCNLGSINLSQFYLPESNSIAWSDLVKTVHLAVRFLDDVIEVNPYPLPEIDELAKEIRRIGLGVMGWADLLFKIGIPYDSEQALHLADEVMYRINIEAHRASQNLAEERGAFPLHKGSIYRDAKPMRNCTVTTIAPTGSISIIAGCSSGIEPVFALSFQHRANGRELTLFSEAFEEAVRGAQVSEGVRYQITDHVGREGTLTGIERRYGHHVGGEGEEVKRLKSIFRTAQEISPEWHVRMQAAFQKHTDNGVSKTVNLPNSATRDDIANAYLQAYNTGCLGITVFRDGCKGEQVLNVGSKKATISEAVEQAAEVIMGTDASDLAQWAESNGYVADAVAKRREEATAQEFEVIAAADNGREIELHVVFPQEMKPRPRRVHGTTHRIETPVGSAFITLNRDEDDIPFEVFINVGKAGSDILAMAEALGRCIALVLRMPSSMDVPTRVRELVDQLDNIAGSRSVGFGVNRILSLPDAVAVVLEEYLREASDETPAAETDGQYEDTSLVPVKTSRAAADICPRCGTLTFVRSEGCQTCISCGHSAC